MSIFQKVFGRTFLGALSTNPRKNPTLGISLHLFRTGKGNAAVRRTAKSSNTRSVRYVNSRRERY